MKYKVFKKNLCQTNFSGKYKKTSDEKKIRLKLIYTNKNLFLPETFKKFSYNSCVINGSSNSRKKALTKVVKT